ncbi:MULTISPECIES: ABC transporter permease [Listeria]|uniref:ABC transporter permease n=1 Tax=Listeria TaxID=1637 RepID=UPI001FCA0996|nr:MULTISPECIES: ABC transporter permease [Listeria]
MAQMGWIFKHNWDVLKKSKVRMIMIIGLPILSILIYFFSYGTQMNDTTVLKLGVVNQDSGMYTNQLVTFLKEDNAGMKEVSYEKGKAELIGGQLDALILIQKGANDSLANQTASDFKIESIQGGNTINTTKMLLSNEINKLLKLEKLGGQANFEQTVKTYDASKLPIENTDLKDQSGIEKMMSAQILGFLCMMLLYAAGSLGELILKEKEEGTFYRLMSTPLSSKKYLLGNALFAYVIVLVEVLICLFAMRFAFRINPGVAYVDLFAILAVFSLMAVVLSLAFGFVAGSRRSISAMQTTIFTISTLLSGALIPIAIMPEIMQKIAAFMPQYWVMDAVSKLQQNGTLADLSLNIIILLGYTLLFFSIASYKFAKNKELRSFV